MTQLHKRITVIRSEARKLSDFQINNFTTHNNRM